MGWVQNVTPEVQALSHYQSIIGVCLATTTLMCMFVLMRMYLRIFILKTLGSSDIVTACCAIISIVYNILGIWQTRLGLGLPVLLRPKSDIPTYSVLNFAGRPLYMAVITGYKVAVCLNYLEILRGAWPKWRLYVTIILVTTVLSHAATTLVIVLQCRPVEKSWRPWVGGSCLPNFETWIATACPGIICDFAIFLTAVPLISRLQIKRSRKIELIFLFGIGVVTSVCSIMRMLSITQVKKDGNNWGLVLWGSAEMNTGIVCSCLPSVKSLFNVIGRGSAADTTQHSSSYPLTDLGSGQSQPPPIPCTKGDRKSSESRKNILGPSDLVAVTEEEEGRIRKKVVVSIRVGKEGPETRDSMPGW